MEFICTHCQKPIYSVAVILDRKHFVHETCKEDYENNILKSEEDAKVFFETLANPPKPNSALRKALKRFVAFK